MAPKRTSKRKAKKTELAEAAEAAEVAEAQLEELLSDIERLPPDQDEEPPKKKKRQPKKPKLTEPTLVENGWVLHPPTLIYKPLTEAQGGAKIAGFDLDGTLITTKLGAERGEPKDWKWFNKQVPAKLLELADQGYQLAIFTNCTGVKGALEGKSSENVRQRVDLMLQSLEKKLGKQLPMQVFIATQNDPNKERDFREDVVKPGLGLWTFFALNANEGVVPDVAQSFFVGNSAGRPGDISTFGKEVESFDKDFAASLGCKFMTPEEVFGPGDQKRSSVFEGDSDAGHNTELAEIFRRLVEQGKRNGGNPFGIRALEKVAGIISAWPEEITDTKAISKEKGVGKSSIAKIQEYLETGKVSALEEADGGEAPPQDKMALNFLE